MRHDVRLVDEMNKDFTAPEVLLLSRRDIEELLSMGETLKAVEYSFKLEAEDKTIMPPKLYLNLPQYRGDFRAMPVYIDGMAGVKWVACIPITGGGNYQA
jgi:alanine dehydrogenase